ncbi:hypothetical protein LPJ63_001944 [Coemansia sp. RSA 2711]|nr:hypothetical protein LPJ63_001944 [Coemansia sp. RSA 2711]KAJ2310873.1 hypothetical protein IWW54_002954 [Coemansia sp. RSA 2705]
MNVIDKQRFYQAGHGPIYQRTPASRFAQKGLYALLICGGTYAAYNLGRLILGKKP